VGLREDAEAAPATPGAGAGISGTPPTRVRLAAGFASVLLAGLALRLFFVFTTHAVLDADEAIVGLMGRHILHGEFPIFFYGQKYMGSLEAHLGALGFALGGATPLVLTARAASRS
jgi:hypothetical protein